MNNNTPALLLPSRLRPTAPKAGSRGFCSEEGFRPEIARLACSKATQRRVALLSQVFCEGKSLHASVLPSQTVCPEPIQSGYFLL